MLDAIGISRLLMSVYDQHDIGSSIVSRLPVLATPRTNKSVHQWSSLF
jgi:hypothetical protein